MDPLTHTFAGAALARTRLGRAGRERGVSAGIAAATLVIGANLPDVDVVCYFVGSDFALAHRRGWTHGVLAMAVLPVVLALLTLGISRLRRRRGPGPPAAAPFRPLLLLAAIGVWSHPLLDWLNTYGVRFLAPFDWTWFYGDAVYIVDPWLWLLLGGALFLGLSRSAGAVVAWSVLAAAASWVVLGSAPGPARAVWLGGLALLSLGRWRGGAATTAAGAERTASFALALAGVYVAALVASSAVGRAMVRERIASGPAAPAATEVMVGPVAADPFRRQVVAETGAGYRLGALDWLAWRHGSPAIELEPGTVPTLAGSAVPAPLLRRALASPSVEGMTTWMRFPTASVEAARDGAVVHLVDLRYARRPAGGFGTASVRVERAPP